MKAQAPRPPPVDADGIDGWLNALRAAFGASLSFVSAQWQMARDAAGDDEALRPVLAEAALRALETMGATEPTSWGMIACAVLGELGDPRLVPRLRAARPRLPARRALRDWRLEASYALACLEARAGDRCPCDVHARHGRPVHGPGWTVEDERVDVARYCIHMTVRCTRCDTRYTVLREDSYHYPVFRWRRSR